MEWSEQRPHGSDLQHDWQVSTVLCLCVYSHCQEYSWWDGSYRQSGMCRKEVFNSADVEGLLFTKWKKTTV